MQYWSEKLDTKYYNVYWILTGPFFLSDASFRPFGLISQKIGVSDLSHYNVRALLDSS